MSDNIIPFDKVIKEATLVPTEPFETRLSRIRASIAKIDKLMRELKEYDKKVNK